MRPVIYKLFLFVFFIAVVILKANAQTCNGSLGDPVINETFGAGTGNGPPLAAGITTLNYVTGGCPDDGSYTIVNSVNLNNSCHPTWQMVTRDHTGDPNGYMMLVNASQTPDVFFIQQAHGLCPGTTYEFAAWILNLITSAAATAGTSEPSITFSIETLGGAVLATYNTGTIPPTATPTWVQYGKFFTTPPGVSDVVVRMINNAPGGNGNDLILDDITFRACGPILQAGIATATGPVTQSLCAGNNASYTLQAAYTTGLINPVFQWQSNINGAGWIDMPGQTTNTLNVSYTNVTTGTYQYRFGASELANVGSPACRVYSNVVEFDAYALPVVAVSPTQAICEGGSIQLSASGGVSYQWSGPGLVATSQNPVTINNITPAQAGNYTVVVTSPQNCSVTATAQVIVYPKVTATVSANPTICQGQSTTLNASGGTTYLWSPSKGLSDTTSSGPVANPLDTTTYTVRVSNANGCFDTKSVTVNVLQKPVANAGTKKVIFEGQSVKLTASTKGDVSNVYWTPTDYLDNPNTLNPVASPVKDITYTLHVLSANNCGSDTSSVFVRVYNKIIIPNTFSPNKDGINDFWNIDALITYPNCLVTIFNRYGTQIYKSTGYSTPWNGTYKGLPIPVGTYYYVIDLQVGTPKLSGWVFVVR
ncbi:MAG: type sorting protein [Mucilaginibacter sp.]|nr:type sorting protein [Mucilaginibacter sp.]